jgi:hypothetical protein
MWLAGLFDDGGCIVTTLWLVGQCVMVVKLWLVGL